MIALAEHEPPSIERSIEGDLASGEIMGGRYRLGAILGRGGMGEVYRAFDVATARAVALKRFRLSPDREDDKLRFRREFHTLAQLSHPRIVQAFDFAIDEGGQPFYTMELLDGRDLGKLAPMPWKRACPLLRDVASALAYLHSRQLLHRDIAPRNVRCTSDGRAKLIDFGMMATVGVSNEIVGTLPSIAPEMILGLPMDGRADLFGLGALAFWLLTGRHPQRVRSLDDLMRNGRRPPPPPSKLVKDIPPALDDLILSLLSSEPLGRPAGAGAVIDRLTAIADLPQAPELDVAQGYVHSAGLVGRTREMDLLRKRIERTVAGHGSSVLIEGRSGMGKTRLMREIELEAKLAGALVLRGEGQITGPYALIRTLARELELGVRGGVIGNSGPHGALIDRLLPVLGAPRRGTPTMSSTETMRVDHREERLALQTALSDFMSTFATHRPLVLLIDNIHRVDEGSAAVLASLAHLAKDRSLLLVGAVRTDEPVRASGALSNIAERAVRVRTRALEAKDLEGLVGEMFGSKTANLVPLAQWLHEASGGVPMLCIELVRHLVDRGHIRYLGGAWMLPPEVPDQKLPQRLEQAFDARVAGLSKDALSLAQGLAVLGHEAPLPLCISLLPGLEEQAVFAAVDELVSEEIVLGSGERYALRHDGLKEALQRTLSEEGRRKLELAVGELLAAQYPDSVTREARIGWHLLRGGERRRGARLLADAGERLFEATSFEDCVEPLEAALEVYEEEGNDPARVARIHYMLVAAGFYVDREVAVRHRERAFEVLSADAGLHRAPRWQKVFGARFGLIAALIITGLLRLLKLRRGLPPVEALELYLRASVYAAGVAGFSFETETLHRCANALAPLRALNRIHVQNGIGLIDNLRNFNLGRLGTLMSSSELNLANLAANDRVTEEERALSLGGARFQRGLVAARKGDGAALEEIRELESLGPRIWAIGALQLRTYYHMWRGESAEARRAWGEAELEHVRLGALWQLHAIHRSSACITEAVIGDALGLKRSIEGLTQQVEQGLRFSQHLHIARAEYETLGGNYDVARDQLEAALKLMPEGEGLARPWALTAVAGNSLAAGDFERAEQEANVALEHASSKEYGQFPFELRALRFRALAISSQGRHEQAAELLDALIERVEASDNPLHIGSAHEARALVALDAEEIGTARIHCEAVSNAFQPTRNPVLVARYERLARQCKVGIAAEDPSVDSTDIATQVFGNDTVQTSVEALMSQLSGIHTPQGRADRALAALVTNTNAERGYLYLMRKGRLELIAPTQGAEPPQEVPRALQETLAAIRPDTDEVATLRHKRERAWKTVLLHADVDNQFVVIGAAVLLEGARPFTAPPEALCNAIGQRLHDEGDVIPDSQHTGEH